MLGGSSIVRAVDGVDLELFPGETLTIVGESGCGKSTLGQTILKLHEPTDGSIRLGDEDLTELSRGEMRPYRRRMQMIFQDPLASLNPRQTVGEILKAPMEVHDIGEDDADRTERVEQLLTRVGLKPGHIDRHPHQFSGGQQQRVGIARALAVDPDFIIADEPVSALDVSVQAQILNLLEELQEEFGLSLIFIAHDLSVVRHIADRVAVMYLGEIVETASVEALFEDPRHPYTKSLLSAVPRINRDARTDRVVLEGTVPSPIDPPSGCRFHTRCPVVIPPDDWAGTQDQFRAVFTFRNRILANEIDPAAIRTRLEADDRSVDTEDVTEQILARSLPLSVESIPPAAAETVMDAAQALANDEHDRAVELVRDTFPSPCERSDPRMVASTPDHHAHCHRQDPDAPGNPIDW